MKNKEHIKEPNYFEAECGNCHANNFIGHKFVNYKIQSMFVECKNCGECFDYEFKNHLWMSKRGYIINEKEAVKKDA